MTPEEMRHESARLLGEAQKAADPAKKRMLASKAFQLAQSAEATERAQRPVTGPGK